MRWSGVWGTCTHDVGGCVGDPRSPMLVRTRAAACGLCPCRAPPVRSKVDGEVHVDPGPREVTVLTVDDQEIFLRTARRLLAATNGFVQVGEATSGAQAIELAAELQPDLVLVDVRMAEMDGIETARRMQAFIPDSMVVLISVEEIPDAARMVPGVAACLRKQELSARTLRALWAARSATASGR
jgi:CheY-like chemotaxis protein